MKLDNKAARKPFQGPGRCDHCGRPCNSRDAAHVISRGAGGPDHALNLVALGSAFGGGCLCHHLSHNTLEVTQPMLWEAVARREKWLTASECEDVIRRFIRTPKEAMHAATDLTGAVAVCGMKKPLHWIHGMAYVGDPEKVCPLCLIMWSKEIKRGR